MALAGVFPKRYGNQRAEPPEKELRTIKQIVDDIWENRDKDYNIRCLVRRLQRIDKECRVPPRELFGRLHSERRHGDVRSRAGNETRKRFSTGTMSLLRKPDFQDLLVNIARTANIRYCL